MDKLNEAEALISAAISDRTNINISLQIAEWAKINIPDKVLDIMANAKNEIEQSNVNPWAINEAISLIFATLAPAGKSDDYFYSIVDRSINRGISENSNEQIMTLVCNRLIYLWNKGVKPEEKHLDAFESAMKTKDILKNDESLGQSLKDVRKKYNLQKSILKQGLEKIGLD